MMAQASEVPDDLVRSLHQVHVEELVFPLLLQLVVILLVARLFGRLALRFQQPAAVGELLAGLLLGPSFFGHFFPDAARWLFQPALGTVPPVIAHHLFGLIFTTLSQLGLILLLFLVGLEFDFKHLREHGKSAVGISLSGLILPFVLGLAIAPVLLNGLDPAQTINPNTGKAIPTYQFALFLGTALAITALPMLGRMLVELNVTRTRLATVTIAAAAIEDALGWIILAAVAGAVRAGFELLPTLQMLGMTLIFGAAMLFVIRPLMKVWLKGALVNGELTITSLTILLAVVFLCAIVTSWIGIFAIFGAFLLGAVLSDEEELRLAVARKLHAFVAAFFLPIFFTYTGLQTNIGSLDSAWLWLLCGLVLTMAVAGKWIGCGLSAYASGFSAREASLVGVMMNTRGLMELIVVNLGKTLGVVPEPVYCMLVLMALMTTLMTTPCLLWLAPGTELEPGLRASPFGDALPKPEFQAEAQPA